MMQRNTLGIIHRFLEENVQAGMLCIDATAGKGRDTALLCRLAGPSGRVLSFDIQQEAVVQTEKLLRQQGLRAEIHLDSHVHMGCYVEPETVDAIVFNFGRLPGGDPHIFTRAETSVPAVREGLRLLKPGGIMAIALYYGGENGYGERDAVLELAASLPQREFTVLSCQWANRGGDPPLPVLIWKEETQNTK